MTRTDIAIVLLTDILNVGQFLMDSIAVFLVFTVFFNMCNVFVIEEIFIFRCKYKIYTIREI